MARSRTLVRTHVDGAVFTDGLVGSTREQHRSAEQRVAWCATDNLAMSRAAASEAAAEAGKAFRAGEPFDLGPYHFELCEDTP
jgi:hypothetical protein